MPSRPATASSTLRRARHHHVTLTEGAGLLAGKALEQALEEDFVTVGEDKR